MKKRPRVSAILGVVAFLAAASPGTAAEPETPLVQSVDLGTLVRSVLPSDVQLDRREVQRRGVRVWLTKDGKYIGAVQLGVFADKAAAERVLEEHLRFMSLLPPSDPGATLGQRRHVSAKNHWALWQRDNVTASLSLPEELLGPAAAAMDKALAAGDSGVSRGKSVALPRILSVDVPARTVAGTAAPVKITVAVPDGANGDGVELADGHGICVTKNVVGEPKEVQVAYTLHCGTSWVCREPEERQTYWICYGTAGCAVVWQKVTITVVPK